MVRTRYVDLCCSPCGAVWKRLVSPLDPVRLHQICCPVCHQIGGAHITGTGVLETKSAIGKAASEAIQKPQSGVIR